MLDFIYSIITLLLTGVMVFVITSSIFTVIRLLGG